MTEAARQIHISNMHKIMEDTLTAPIGSVEYNIWMAAHFTVELLGYGHKFSSDKDLVTLAYAFLGECK